MTLIINNGALLNGVLKAFTPLDLNPVLWLDANDLSTITKDGANRVSQWDDKSGNGYHAVQGTELNQPIYTSSKIGIRPALDFDGPNQWMLSSYNITPEHHFFVVYIHDAVPFNNISMGIFGNYDGSGAAINGEMYFDTIGEVGADRWRYITFGGSFATAELIIVSTPYLMEGYSEAGIIELFENNVSRGNGVTTATNTLSRGLAIATQVYTGGIRKLNGAIGDILIFSNRQTGSDLVNLRNYYARKYLALGI